VSRYWTDTAWRHHHSARMLARLTVLREASRARGCRFSELSSRVGLPPELAELRAELRAELLADPLVALRVKEAEAAVTAAAPPSKRKRRRRKKFGTGYKGRAKRTRNAKRSATTGEGERDAAHEILMARVAQLTDMTDDCWPFDGMMPSPSGALLPVEGKSIPKDATEAEDFALACDRAPGQVDRCLEFHWPEDEPFPQSRQEWLLVIDRTPPAEFVQYVEEILGAGLAWVVDGVLEVGPVTDRRWPWLKSRAQANAHLKEK
jgi:hypothetical protein